MTMDNVQITALTCIVILVSILSIILILGYGNDTTKIIINTSVVFENDLTENEPESDTTGYRIFNSTDAHTEIGYASDVCIKWWTTPIKLYCLEKELTEFEKIHFKIKADCHGHSECMHKKKLDYLIEEKLEERK